MFRVSDDKEHMCGVLTADVIIDWITNRNN